jgi:hypothetical protein
MNKVFEKDHSREVPNGFEEMFVSCVILAGREIYQIAP